MLGEGESGMKEKKIMIVEPSPIVQEGLKNIIQRIQDFTVDAFYFDTNRLTEHLLARTPDLLLFNPCLLDPSSRRNIRQLYGINDECSLVAIEYSFVDKEIRDQFDAEISINDNDTRIQNKLQALKKLNCFLFHPSTQDISLHSYNIRQRNYNRWIVAVAFFSG